MFTDGVVAGLRVEFPCDSCSGLLEMFGVASLRCVQLQHQSISAGIINVPAPAAEWNCPFWCPCL